MPPAGQPSKRGVRPSSADAAESLLDHHLEDTIRAVEAAASAGGSAAVKLTALADPALLRHISDMLHDHRRAFRRLNVDQAPSPYVTLAPSPARLRRVLTGPGLSDSEVNDLFRAANYLGNGSLDYVQCEAEVDGGAMRVCVANTACDVALQGATFWRCCASGGRKATLLLLRSADHSPQRSSLRFSHLLRPLR